MRFIYFLIIILIIYYIATQIKVVHLDTLPIEHQIELSQKSNLKSILTPNGIHDSSKNNVVMQSNKLIGLTDKYSSEQFMSTDYKRNYWDLSGGKIHLPSGNNLYTLIKSEYADSQYRFNIPNQPVTTRYPNRNINDDRYLNHIKKDIDNWNELFYKYYQTNQKLLKIKSIKLVFIMETLNEFVIKVNASLSYLGKSLHFQLTYYGKIERNDDFLNGASDVYILQLVDIKPITKSEYQVQNEYIAANEEDTPFMSMKNQLEYVDRINKMHRDENNI